MLEMNVDLLRLGLGGGGDGHRSDKAHNLMIIVKIVVIAKIQGFESKR